MNLNKLILFLLSVIVLAKQKTSNQSSKHNTIQQPIDEKSNTLDSFEKILQKSKRRAAQLVKKDPNYFIKHLSGQSPDFLWIACSDSRVPIQSLLQIQPGQIFIHRNVANLALPHDYNVMAVIQYAIQRLKVTNIVIAGHYGCGGVKAALTNQDFGPLQFWLSNIRKIRIQKASLLANKTAQEKQKIMIEENVKTQVLNLASMSCVQQAWAKNQELHIHGIVYDLQTGIFNDLGIKISGYKDLPKEYHFFSEL